MIQQKRAKNFYTILVAVLVIMTVEVMYAVPCQQFANGRCIRCPVGSHFFQQLCFEDILGCQEYEEGNKCTSCNPSIGVLSNFTCLLVDQQLRNLDEQELRFRTNIGEQFGSPNFILITLQEAEKNEHFKRVDNYMRSSQYSFHISRVANPLVSIHTYIVEDVQHFKILYEGAGGGLFLCIIETNMVTASVTLSSFVAIGKSRIIENCVEYDQLGRCRGCEPSYHLEDDLCYINIGGCVSYFKKICVDCLGFNILTENRCAGDCQAVSDCRGNVYYLGRATAQAVSSQTGNVIDTTIVQGDNTGQGTGENQRDPNCAAFGLGNLCERCSFRFFKNHRGICEAVSPLCNGFDSFSGDCTSCFQGFQLQNGKCDL